MHVHNVQFELDKMPYILRDILYAIEHRLIHNKEISLLQVLLSCSICKLLMHVHPNQFELDKTTSDWI